MGNAKHQVLRQMVYSFSYKFQQPLSTKKTISGIFASVLKLKINLLEGVYVPPQAEKSGTTCSYDTRPLSLTQQREMYSTLRIRIHLFLSPLTVLWIRGQETGAHGPNPGPGSVKPAAAAAKTKFTGTQPRPGVYTLWAASRDRRSHGKMLLVRLFKGKVCQLLVQRLKLLKNFSQLSK